MDGQKWELQAPEWIVGGSCVDGGRGQGNPADFAGAPALWAAKLPLSKAATYADGGSMTSGRAQRKMPGLRDISMARFRPRRR